MIAVREGVAEYHGITRSTVHRQESLARGFVAMPQFIFMSSGYISKLSSSNLERSRHHKEQLKYDPGSGVFLTIFEVFGEARPQTEF